MIGVSKEVDLDFAINLRRQNGYLTKVPRVNHCFRGSFLRQLQTLEGIKRHALDECINRLSNFQLQRIHRGFGDSRQNCGSPDLDRDLYEWTIFDCFYFFYTTHQYIANADILWFCRCN